jgi:hypothetical protein
MGDTAAFSMDTGRLDSHVYFGINAAPKDRVLFRRVTTCAPINGTSFGVLRNTTSLGKVLYVEAGDTTGNNYTFMYQTAAASVTGYQLRYVDTTSGSVLVGSKNISAVYSAVGPTRNETDIGGWAPAAPLQRSDADVTLFILAQGVQKLRAQGPTSKTNNPSSLFNHQHDPLNALN